MKIKETLTFAAQFSGRIMVSILFASIVVLLMISNQEVLNRLGQPIKINLEDIRETAYSGEVRDFLIVAQRFALYHKYTDEYNCVNYSTDLKDIADELGFKVSKIVGYSPRNDTSGHMWLRLEVDFEPQHGEFVDYSVTYFNQTKG